MNSSDYKERLIEIISNMPEDEQKQLLEELGNKSAKKVRRHQRMECLIKVDFAAKGRAFHNYIQDISIEGVFIEARGGFSVGDELLLTISYSDEVKPFKITGEVVRIAPGGIGVRFKKFSQVQEEMIRTIIRNTCDSK